MKRLLSILIWFFQIVVMAATYPNYYVTNANPAISLAGIASIQTSNAPNLNQVTIIGNSTTNSVIGNFVGTNSTTNVTANWFRLNKTYAFSDDSALSLAFGPWAMRFAATNAAFSAASVENTAFGNRAMERNASGDDNSVFGYQALFFNSAGINNSAFGAFALSQNTANDNSSFGYNSLKLNTTGTRNSAFGSGALQSNTNLGNSAFGCLAMNANVDGFNNSAFGDSAMQGATNSRNCSAFGNFALQFSQGQNSTAFGYKALWKNVTGRQNLALGFETAAEFKGSELVAIGGGAAYDNSMDTNTWSIIDTNCIFLGVSASRSETIPNTTSMTNSFVFGNYGKVNGNNQVRLGNDRTLNVITSGTLNATNGIASCATNQLTITVTGLTNSLNKNVQVLGFTGVSVSFKDCSGAVISLGTITSPTVINLQPGGALDGTTCAASGVIAF